MSSSVLYFVVVGEGDRPIFEADLTPRGLEAAQGAKDDRPQYLYHFVLHASLDAVEDVEWTSPNAFLGAVDRFNSLIVSAHVTSSRARLLLLHDGRPEDAVRAFLKEVGDAFVRAAANPFFDPGAHIESPTFARRVRFAAKSHLR